MSLDTPAEPELAAPPPVVAVMVTHNPGEWFDSALAALSAQDYENLSILVIDAASDEDPTGRVASVAPDAFVRRLATDPGWPTAANEALAMVQGAAYLLFLHDDVAAAPDAVRLLVEEAYRSNAGIVGPKLVDWDEHERIASAGLTIDKTGVVAPLVEPGELDQEQHDAVRDVFAVDGAMLLVRADLANTISGFAPRLWPHGEDIDFCWRAQIAGARVLVAPAARASHRAATLGDHRSPRQTGEAEHKAKARHRDEVRAAEVRHRIRMVLTNYTPTHLIRVIPQMLVVQLGELVYALVAGRRRVAQSIVGGWADAFRDLRSVRRPRKQVDGYRQFPDSEIRRMQARGFPRINRFVRGQLHGEDRARAFAESGAGFLKEVAGSRGALGAWAVLLLVMLVGTRELLFGALPAVGQLTPFSSVGSMFREFVSGWRLSGLGSESPAPPALALLALAGTLLFGAVGVLQKLLVLGMVPLGLFGAYRLARSVDVPRAGLVGLAAYAAIPLPYAALARGRWDGLIAYAIVPWLFSRMRLGAEGHAFRAAEPADGRHREPFLFDWRSALGISLLLAVGTMFVPGLLAVTLVLAIGIAVGSYLVGEPGDARRAVSLSAIAIGVAFFLLAPWSITMLHPEGALHALFGPGLSSSRGLSFGSALRLETGRLGGAPFGWALLVAAALPLAIGRGWRLSWAIRCWSVIVVTAVFVTLAGRGWLGIPVPSPDVFLAPAGIAVAWAIALGFISFRIDLREFRFGWPQVAAGVASVAFGIGALPLLGAAGTGRWGLQQSTLASQLAYIDDSGTGEFRVLWVGDPETLPVDSWRLAPGLSFGTSRNGLGKVTEQWAPNRPGPSRALGDALKVALNGRTTQLGHLLGPMGVRYVVVPRRVGPRAAGRPLLAPSRDIGGALAEQTDFRQLAADTDLAVFENASWIPIRAAITAEQAATIAAADKGFRAAGANDIGGAKPALTTRNSPFSYAGTLGEDAGIFFGETPSGRWKLDAGGDSVERDPAFGLGSVYAGGGVGKATLTYSTSPVRWLSLLLEAIVWILVVRGALRWRKAARGEAQ